MKKQFKWGLRLITLLILSISALEIDAQNQLSISGKVFDLNNDPLIGAALQIKGDKSIGTVTDIDGNFTLKVHSKNTVLLVSYIGCKTLEYPLKGKLSNIIIRLEDDSKLIDEVVVVGYGTQKKGHLTGSVSSVSAKELMKAPMQNVSNMLAGKISGLTSIQSSGMPGGDDAKIYVRGINSFAGGSSPMIIVDGVPRQMSYINPNDIESISVLKDAAAAIYGVDGANGVILITSKSGTDGPATISYNGSATMTSNTAMPEFLNAKDYMYWHNKARALDGLTPMWSADIQNKVLNNDPTSIWGESDWLDEIFRTGITQQHNLSASGGTNRVKYYASLGIMDQEGTLKNTAYTRYNLRTNLDIQVAKNLKFTANIAGVRADQDLPGTSISNQGEFNPIRQAINSIPIIKSHYNGLPTAWMGSAYYVNGYAALMESGFKKSNRWNLDTNFKLEYDFSDLTNILKGLKASMFASYNYSNTTNMGLDYSYQLYGLNAQLNEGIVNASGFKTDNSFSKSASWGDKWMIRPQIEYSRAFKKNYIAALFLYEAQKGLNHTMTGTKRGYYGKDPVDLSLGTVFPDNPVSGSHSYNGAASWVGRLNYSYDQKYLAEVAFRRDGTYIFAPENRWGFFPSASLGWVISQENFIKDNVPFLDYFKIRASYGEYGKSNADPYLYNSIFQISNNSMVLGGNPIAQYYSKNAYVYRNLTWSTTQSYNLGIEANMWNQLLGVEIDLFYQLTADILEKKSGMYPSSLGGYFPSIANTGKVANKGVELNLKHRNTINEDWRYNVSGIFSFARNKVLSKALSDNYPNYRGVLGNPMGARFGYEALGLFQTQEELDNYPAAPSGTIGLGDIKYRDINGDGLISPDHDYVKIGYGAIPEINFSLNLELNYKNFYMNMSWQGVTHCDYELSGEYESGTTAATVYTSTFASSGNSPYYLIENSWTPDNINAKYPRLTTVPNGNSAWRSTMWLVNGEYLRLKNMNIGFNFPSIWLRKTPFSRVNIYLAGTNLLTFSHFKYVDPESPSVSNGYYPQQRTYSFGLNVTF